MSERATATAAAATNLYQFPNAPTLDPTNAGGDFDIVSELQQNRKAYTGGDAKIPIRSFPVYLLNNARRIAIKVENDDSGDGNKRRRSATTLTKVRINPVLRCALSHGLNVLDIHADLALFADLAVRFSELETVHNADAVTLAENWYRSLGRGTVPSGPSGVTFHTVFLPSDQKSYMNEVREQLGVDYGDLAVLAMCVTLCDQCEVLPEHALVMESSVNSFLRNVRVRHQLGTRLLDCVKGMILGESTHEKRLW